MQIPLSFPLSGALRTVCLAQERKKKSFRPSRAALLKEKEVLAFSKFDLMSATWEVGAIQKRFEDLQAKRAVQKLEDG